MKACLAALLLLGIAPAWGDVVIYQGSQVVSTISAAGTTSVVEPVIQVIDLENSQMVLITLGESAGKKTFSAARPAPAVRTEVNDSRGAQRGFTVLAQAVTTTDAATGVTTVTNFLQTGANVPVNIKGTEKVSLPRNMQGSGSVVSTAGKGGIAAELMEVKAALALRDFDSRTCNDAGDTLAAAVVRITASLAARGFVSAGS